jgi:hypothetical protein
MSVRARTGLTVLELVIILVIIGVLLFIVVPRFTAPTLTMVSSPDSVVAPGATGEVTVKVTNRSGLPQRGARIEFEATGGMVVPRLAEADSAGIARATWTAGADSGRMTIIAHLDGRTTPEVTMTSRVQGSAAPVAAPTAPAAQPVDSSRAAADTARARTDSAASPGASKTPAQTPATTPPATKRP